MKYILKTSKLSLNPNNNQNKSIIYTGSPNKDQKDKGKLIVMLDFPDKTENTKELGNLLVQKIHKLYYESSLIDQESILEEIIKGSNENLPLLTEIDKDWLKKFNALIAIIYRQNVYFSPVGNISAWVNSQKGKIINIFDYVNSDIEKATVDNIFTNILSGNLDPGQSLIFTTNTIFDYISENKIDTIMKENDPQGIAIKLKELLFQIKDKSFCLASIKLSPYEESDKHQESTREKILVSESAKESIDNLLNIQQKTKDILTKGKTKTEESETQEKTAKELRSKKLNQKSFDDLLEESVQEYEEAIISQDIKEKLQEEISINPNENLYSRKKQKPQNKIDILKILNNILKIIVSPFIKILNAISKIKLLRKNKDKNMLISRKQEGPISVFKSPKKKNKLILILAIIILVVFIISLILTNKKRESVLENEKYNKILSEINDKKMEYDLANIYKDENQAKEKLKEISDLVNSLPQKTKKQQEQYSNILNSVIEILNKVRKMETITNPEILAELNFNANKIIKQGDQLIVLGSNSSEISKIDTNSKSQTNIGRDSSYTNINTFAKNGDYIIGLDIKDLIKINSTNSEITKESITYHPNYKSSNDAEFYAENLYILDSQSNQIYKHLGNNGKLGKGDTWIKDASSVSNSNCITIDTNIYIGNNDGSILKMYSGKKLPFELKDVDPKISKIDKIYTDKTIKEIYLLESQSRRIIIIDKDGNLLKQYYLPTLKEIDNFSIDGATKKLYILSDSKIITINISL
ncbi:MAG: hypothetical protein PHH83_01110 [Patescibacteria group bacterium]|nr:hypothetical protein [Patescibacteria group bacterium]